MKKTIIIPALLLIPVLTFAQIQPRNSGSGIYNKLSYDQYFKEMMGTQPENYLSETLTVEQEKQLEELKAALKEANNIEEKTAPENTGDKNPPAKKNRPEKKAKDAKPEINKDNVPAKDIKIFFEEDYLNPDGLYGEWSDGMPRVKNTDGETESSVAAPQNKPLPQKYRVAGPRPVAVNGVEVVDYEAYIKNKPEDKVERPAVGSYEWEEWLKNQEDENYPKAR